MHQHQQQHEEDEHDDEEMGVAETYADYWPSKCNTFESQLKIKIF